MVAIKARLAKSTIDRAKGLIGNSAVEPLLLQTRFGIHTFGMKKPIDVLILDDENRVRALKKCLKPMRIFFWNPRYTNVLELPDGFISEHKLKIMDRVGLKVA